MDGIEVHFPRFLAVPGMLRRLDGFFMALACLPLLLKLRRSFGANLIDAHFAFPDGVAARHLSRWSGLPFTVTLRGTEPGHLQQKDRRGAIERVFREANRVIGVSRSLADLSTRHGAPPGRVRVVGNGVDIDKFVRQDREQARSMLELDTVGPVLISVGGLVERKGFHRVIELLPELRQRWRGLRYLIVGGASPEGDMSEALRGQVERLGCGEIVRFCGQVAPASLSTYLSAADLFVLATRNEGWANVFLEAMACGLPVITTNVGGNAEVVSTSAVGTVVPFGDRDALMEAISDGLERAWDRDRIVAYAKDNQWTKRIDALQTEFRAVVSEA